MKWLLPLLLLPLTAFGTITATNRGTGSGASSGTSLVITLGSMTAGNTGVICLAMDNANSAGANLISSYTDSVGNVWYVRSDSSQAATANNIQELAILTSNLTASTSSSNSLTVGLSVASAANAWSFIEASTAVSGAKVFYQNSAVATNSASGTTASITNNFGPSNGDLAIGCGAVENGTPSFTDDTDTLNGSWTASQSTSMGSGTSGMAIITQTKIVNLYGAQAYDVTVGATNDIRPGWAVLTEAAVNARSIGGDATSSTTLSIPVNLPIAAGSLAVLCVSADNAGGASANLPSSITDGGSNTWTRRQNAAYNISGANTGVEQAIYTGAITTGINPGSNISGTAGITIPAKTWVLWEFAPTGAGTVTYTGGASPGGSTTGTPLIGIGSASYTTGDYLIGMTAAEGLNTFVGDSDTLDGAWLQQATAGKGATSSVGNCITSQYKKTTGNSSQTYNTTLTSADTIVSWINITDSSATGITTQQKAGFFMLFP